MSSSQRTNGDKIVFKPKVVSFLGCVCRVTRKKSKCVKFHVPPRTFYLCFEKVGVPWGKQLSNQPRPKLRPLVYSGMQLCHALQYLVYELLFSRSIITMLIVLGT